MTTADWLVVIGALLALAYRKRIIAMLRWHPVVLIANVAVVVLVVASIAVGYFLIVPLYKNFGIWGMGGLVTTGVVLHIWHRIRYGYWLGD